MDKVDSVAGLIDEVAYAAARGNLVLPLRIWAASQRSYRQPAAEAVLPARILL
ncbi:MAG TPA: hypothetical protein VIR33_10000 [Thermopolyspora sp.]|jgi:hypothetical protein